MGTTSDWGFNPNSYDGWLDMVGYFDITGSGFNTYLISPINDEHFHFYYWPSIFFMDEENLILTSYYDDSSDEY